MTVGLSLTNSLEAVVITDSRVSGLGRQSDSVNKMGVFSKSSLFHGVIFGTGSGNLIEGVTRSSQEVNAPTLDDYAAQTQRIFTERYTALKTQAIATLRHEIELKMGLLPEAERGKPMEIEIHRAMDAYEEQLRNSATYFSLCAFDNKQGHIRQFFINNGRENEYFGDHQEIGAGSDGANMYFFTKLQGVNPKKLTTFDLFFHGVNAYSLATVNQGVGGTPKIAFLNKKEALILDPVKVRALTNLSGAYLADFIKPSRRKIEGTIRDIVFAKRPDYDSLAKDLRLSLHSLKTTAIPYSAWQERANASVYR